jgi:hypothetical protein
VSCADPGCIRNSECGPSYRCREARCVPANTPANGAGSGASGADNSGSNQGTGTPQQQPDAAGVEILDAAVATDAPSP